MYMAGALRLVCVYVVAWLLWRAFHAGDHRRFLFNLIGKQGDDMGELRIEYISLGDLRRWPRNPKDHDLGAIHSSIARFGFVNPIIVNEATGLILAGHGRLDTLLQRQAAGEPLPKGLRSDSGQWLVPIVRGISLPSEEAEAYAVADNRLVELGGWDSEQLAEVLSDLATMPDGLDGVGYDGDDLDALLAELADPIKWDGKGPQDRSGSSPWERIGEAGPGVIVQIGEIHCRINTDVYNRFLSHCPVDGIAEHVEGLLDEICGH